MADSDQLLKRPSLLTQWMDDVSRKKRSPRQREDDKVSLADLSQDRQDSVELIKPELPNYKYIVAVDFDGTCVTHEYPKVGKDCPHAVEVLKQIVSSGAGIILFTMRHGDYLNEAVRWFAEREIPLYGIQLNPTQHTWTSSTKCYAHLYIDDAALGCPLLVDPTVAERPFVDWIGVDKLLQKHDWYLEPTK